jgi:glycosyltransferase involved in cell wall biosynthesis
MSPHFEYHQIEESGYILFAAGRIMSSKGCHLLFDALLKINFKGKILVLGSLVHESEYTEYLLSFKEKLDIKFLGLVRDKSELFGYLISARFFVFPSLNESMSMMLLEAVMLKVPVIASDIAPNKDIFNESEILFFENNNSDDLGNKISWALENDIVLKSMADNAFHRGINEYDWSSISLNYKIIYDRILAK